MSPVNPQATPKLKTKRTAQLNVPSAVICIGAGAAAFLACLLCVGIIAGVVAVNLASKPQPAPHPWFDPVEAKTAGDRLKKWNDLKEAALREAEAADASGDPARIRAANKKIDEVWENPPK